MLDCFMFTTDITSAFHLFMAQMSDCSVHKCIIGKQREDINYHVRFKMSLNHSPSEYLSIFHIYNSVLYFQIVFNVHMT